MGGIPETGMPPVCRGDAVPSVPVMRKTFMPMKQSPMTVKPAYSARHGYKSNRRGKTRRSLMKIAGALLSVALLFGTGAATTQPVVESPQPSAFFGCPPWLFWGCGEK